MLLQRTRVGESRVSHRLSNGPLRAQSNELVRFIYFTFVAKIDIFTIQSILRRDGIRQLPGICWYPAKRTASL